MTKFIKGKVRIDKKTKDLVKRLKPGEVAIIDHENIDEIAAQALLAKKVQAVVNCNLSIGGKYPNMGPLLLVEQGVALIDNCGSQLLDQIDEGEELTILGNMIFRNHQLLTIGEELTQEKIFIKIQQCKENLGIQLSSFVQNTLEYAWKEQNLVISNIPFPQTISMEGKQVLIVVRGKGYQQDLKTIGNYISEVKPVIVAVDGAADALLEAGYLPHIIIGDMDSVSDKALKAGSQLLVHAYQDGRAPGLKRLNSLGLKSEVVAAPGTSEDMAMLLAYQKGADLIVALGTHSNMIDFLEKGRQGMASTFLVRMKVGDILMDAKGVSKLYSHKVQFRYVAKIVAAALLPLTIVSAVSPYTYQFFRLLLLKMQLITNF